MTLADLKPGQSGEILKVNVAGALKRRLMDMGVVSGTNVRVEKVAPLGDPEVIARDYLVHEKPDVILNVIDATNLERNLYFTLQLLELGIPLVMALNHRYYGRGGVAALSQSREE